MKRIPSTPRADWQATAEQLGFAFHTFDGEPYWDESAYYRFSLRQIEDDLEDPTQELHELCMALVAEVVDSEELLERLAIPAAFHELIRQSWKQGDPHLYGRMDLCYDGTGPAKLLETNYDTPTSLYEASFFQYVWLEQQMQRGQLPAGCDQFNSIEDKLLQAFVQGGFKSPMHFASVRDSLEDRGTVEYLRDIARQAGLGTRLLDIEDIGLNVGGRFVDLLGTPIDSLFKLYPWEHLFNEAFGRPLPAAARSLSSPRGKPFSPTRARWPCSGNGMRGTRTCCRRLSTTTPPPAWARVGAQAVLFPRGRQCGNLHRRRRAFDRGRALRRRPCIRQQFHPLPVFAGNHTVIGSWVIGDQPAGIGIREDNSPITKDSSRFLPHVISD
ncbi:hypothetical protein PBOI14_71250 [Pseudomonas sp. Boi14]|nr:hypothetical protein PBOI14_71250 [Pseudomonas sp. Boi14]